MAPTSESRGPGAGDMFFKVKGAKHGEINGEAQDQKHKNEIEVLAWSWGMQGKSSLGGGVATGKATMRELRITKKVDKSSTALMSALRTNELIKEATLTLRKIGKTPLDVPVSPASVAKGPRRFTVRHAGYVSSRLVQGATNSNVNAMVVLQPRSAPSADKPDAGRGESEATGDRDLGSRGRRRELNIRTRR